MAEANASLLAKLAELEARYNEIQEQISDPEIAADARKLIPLTKEQGKLRDIVSRYAEYKEADAGLKDAEQIIQSDTSDEEFRALAVEEVEKLGRKKQTLLKEMQDSLVMADDKAVNSVIMEIRAGTGGDEAALFARDLFNMYVKYADGRKWKVEQLGLSTTETGGFREVILGIKGPSVWASLCYEGGGHRVQRVPETESQGRIHTSAATVAVLPEPEEIDIKIDANDVKEHVSRASGPGGQSVNKLNSAIKLEHIPTGITVSMRDEKSQHKNRAKAWRILRSRIYEYHESRKRAKRDSQRKAMIGTGERSQKIRTYNFPQNRLTDHRINLTLYSLDKIIAGDLSEVVAALREYDKQQRIENL